MSLVPQFLASMDRLRYLSPAGPSSLITRAVIAVADTLPGVDGAAVCLSRRHGMRVPIAVTDRHSLLAEQLEFTAGFGPGLQCRRTGQPVLAGASLARRYAAFHDGLVTHTAFRAVFAIPMGDHGRNDPSSALLLFYGATALVDQASTGSLAEVIEIALLVGQAVTSTGADLIPSEPEAPTAVPHHIRRRLAVERAVAMIMNADHVPVYDALDILRGHAFARGRLVDDAAHDLVTDVLTVDAFR